ncbi:MAG: guanylate kinase [Gammaproteobacteria bacterium]|nr:guanylate kinase [Gammaproteobacteria bacterium]
MQAIGTLYIVAAASGTGKTSLVTMLVESLNNIIVSVSHTTREPRHGERDEEDYFFIGNNQFEEMIAHDEFLEHAKVFDNYYGTTKSWVNEKLQQGIDVILEIDVQGFQQIKEQNLECVTIFILPPSFEELKKRLEKRAKDSDEIIKKRLKTAHKEISCAQEFDYIVVNDRFDIALVDLRSIIRSHRLKSNIQLTKHRELFNNLINKY